MTEKSCDKPEEHAELHACELKDKERTPQIDKIFAAPRYTCANCGAKTHNKVNLCRPEPL